MEELSGGAWRSAVGFRPQERPPVHAAQAARYLRRLKQLARAAESSD